MLEMFESMEERTNEQQSWLRSVKENSTARQKKKEIREKEKKTLKEENERFRALVHRNRQGDI